ncbi:MAG: hypothetical protein GF317_24375 [Candidatus Lokiarchaeota archaeon]|nr:hypothetical protein [Candidatus Lokiarchaeota archaeon]MBD3202510.1 hypothetical protein [Candidatus Lokiarchaeota archaeon]
MRVFLLRMSEAHDIFETLLKLGISEEDLEEELKQKLLQFHGFITKQGALFLIAKEKGLEVYSRELDPAIYDEAEYNIDYGEFIVDIASIHKDMINIVAVGIISEIFKINKFQRKDGTPGKVASFLLTDSTGTIKVVLWGKKAEILRNEFFKVGKIVQCINGYAKKGLKDRVEIHFSKKSKVILAPQDINKSVINKLKNIKISDKRHNSREINNTSRNPDKIEDLYNMEGFITSISGTIKIVELKEFTKNNREKSFLLKLTLYDETGEIKVKIWGMQAIEILKIIQNGMNVKIFNFLVERNDYLESKEIRFTKKTVIEFL